METPKRRSRVIRILRWLGLVSLGWIALLVLAWFVAGNRIIAALAYRYLPFDLQNGIVVAGSSVAADVKSHDVVLEIEPKRAHELAVASLEQGFPRWIVRAPLAFTGRWSDPEHPELPLTLLLSIGMGHAPPLLHASFDSDGLSEFLTKTIGQPYEAATDLWIGYAPKLAPGCRIDDDGGLDHTPDGPVRRFHAKLHGSLVLDLNDEHADVPVRNLEGTITVLFAWTDNGYAPRISVAIKDLDVDVKPTLSTQGGLLSGMAALGPDNLKKLLETAINSGLNESGPGWLPPWFPIEVKLAASTR